MLAKNRIHSLQKTCTTTSMNRAALPVHQQQRVVHAGRNNSGERLLLAGGSALLASAALLLSCSPHAHAEPYHYQQQQQQQQHALKQQQQQRRPRLGAAAAAAPPLLFAAPPSPVADVAGLLTGVGPAAGGDNAAAEPFTLYGRCSKLFAIENLDGNKVVSRARGFTVDTCVAALAEGAETPNIQNLAPGDKLRYGRGLACRRSTGPELREACASSCRDACAAAVDAEAERQAADTGLALPASDRKRVLRGCLRGCSYGCTGSGKVHDFSAPSRR